ncbi:alpha-1,4-glucan--maltose-1-phosphate maltosyltransferase [Candidatus Auribacterota bacterium]
MKKDQTRITFENVCPQIDCGKFPIKRVTGEPVTVTADIFADGHDRICAFLLYRRSGKDPWRRIQMSFLENDCWEASFSVDKIGTYEYTLEGWVDRFSTWLHDLKKKVSAGQDTAVDIKIGLEIIKDAAGRASPNDSKRLLKVASDILKEKDIGKAVLKLDDPDIQRMILSCPDEKTVSKWIKVLCVTVDRKKALFSAWYEMFPRSCIGTGKKHGTLKDCIKLLPEISRMGFDVLYLPPIHPIGITGRKGKNNTTSAGPEDPGSPWAIGSAAGGHTAVEPALGTIRDLKKLIYEAKLLRIDIALDIAYQCSPDHPYIKEHPEWFRKRPDGTIQYAENPPKKYEDIVPINFDTDNWEALWEELKSIVLFWADQGIKIFRVDNPHTKPFVFWDWMISAVKEKYPDTIFLSEAFTRPKVMYRLAKCGFTQSYTYFTWRNTKYELTEYVKELTRTDVKEFFRANFWPNTPDILPEYLQYGGRPAFIARLVLAATLSSNYGIYGPAFELCEAAAIPGREEYLDSEKYEIKKRDRKNGGSLASLIARVNGIRNENPAFHDTFNIRFIDTDNDMIIAYCKMTEDLSNIIITAVNLDPHYTQSCWLSIPYTELGIEHGHPYLAHDLLTDEKFIWHGDRNFVILDPLKTPAHIIRIHRRVRTENDFDYFQ